MKMKYKKEIARISFGERGLSWVCEAYGSIYEDNNSIYNTVAEKGFYSSTVSECVFLEVY